jgi:hypothetical protein
VPALRRAAEQPDDQRIGQGEGVRVDDDTGGSDFHSCSGQRGGHIRHGDDGLGVPVRLLQQHRHLRVGGRRAGHGDAVELDGPHRRKGAVHREHGTLAGLHRCHDRGQDEYANPLLAESATRSVVTESSCLAPSCCSFDGW